MHVGPDAARYLYAAQGRPVPRPFNLRPALPYLLGTSRRAWWVTWAASWPLAFVGFLWWQGWGWQALAAAAVFLALPGVLGPSVSIPVQVDLPATAVALLGCGLLTLPHWSQKAAGVAVLAAGALVRETVPVLAALWSWSLLPLAGLVVVAVVALVRKPGPDPTGHPNLQYIADHPVRSALDAHRGRWRDGWLMVAPWGVCLLALTDLSWPLVVALVAAYGQLLAATDTVRLVQHVAGPPMAVAAVSVLPPQWWVLAVVVHAVWWRIPERV